MGPRVLKLLANTGDAIKHQDKILAYYRACPEAVDKATLLAIIRLTEEVSATVDSRQRVLDFLPVLADRFDPDAKRELRKLADSPQEELREGALVVLYSSATRARARICWRSTTSRSNATRTGPIRTRRARRSCIALRTIARRSRIIRRRSSSRPTICARVRTRRTWGSRAATR
jgi:hypothetical protein